jgi:phosphate acetyltransferase
MGKNIYISAFEACSGKNYVTFGLASLLREKFPKLAVFRPIINAAGGSGKCSDQPEKCGPDPVLSSLLRHLKLEQSYEDAFAFTFDEARRLLNQGRRDLLLERVIEKYKKLENAYDFVLCLGSDFAPGSAAFEFDLNAELAANLGAPVLLVSKSAGLSSADARDNTLLALKKLEENCSDVLACMFSKSALSAAEVSEVAAALKAGVGHDLAVYNLSAQDCAQPAHKSCVLDRIEKGEITLKELVAQFVTRIADTRVDIRDLLARIEAHKNTRITPKMFEYALLEKAAAKKMRVVLPEGLDERILRAADDLLRREVADLAILGDADKILQNAASLGLDLSRAQIIDPVKAANFEDYAATYQELRKQKGITLEQARQTMSDATYYGTMMVYKGDMDGMVSGAMNTTAHTIRPAFEFIKTRVKGATVSSVFLMCLKDRVLVFGDCAVVPNPAPKELADIAIASADTARVFGIDPRVAMLSYSTGSSGKGPDVEMVIEAVGLAKAEAPDLALEGPLQYDAAIDPGVAATKLPGSKVAGKATVFVFPDLNTGNNTYKAVQRAAGAVAIGPVLQGLNKPVNDLSRGCTVPDIVNTVAITAIQAQAIKK